MDTTDTGEKLEDVLVTAEQLDQRLVEMTEEINGDCTGKEVLLVGVLRGTAMVMAGLFRKIHTPPEVDWMAAPSYGSGTKSSGVVRVLKDLDQDVSGRHVLTVEDIIDSGLTLSWLRVNLLSRGAVSICIVTALRRPAVAKTEVEVTYVGFEIPNEFVVSYGLGYAERYRNLPFMGMLAPCIYEN